MIWQLLCLMLGRNMAKFLDVKVKVNTTGLRNKLNSKRSLIQSIPREAYEYFRKITPLGNPSLWKNPKPPAGYTPGNARRRTELKRDEIHANYPYAYRLDKERWSTQAPNGMSKPTIEYIKKLYRNLMRKR